MAHPLRLFVCLAGLIHGGLIYGGLALAAPSTELLPAIQGVSGKGPDLIATIRTSKGAMRCRLDHAKAPRTVAHFAGLATGERRAKTRRGRFFDGLTFHRVIPDFMIQAGDPSGRGDGGAGVTIPGEFETGLRHDRAGVLSMADQGQRTSDSQFFITLKATPWLDGQHTPFGICGSLDVARRIAAVPVVPANKPREPVVITRIDLEWGTF